MGQIPTCTKGSDASCVTLLGEGACCFYIDVIEGNSNPTANQTESIDIARAFGMPVDKGQSAYLCMSADDIKESVAMENSSDEYTSPEVGITYKAYCAGSMKQAALAAGAAASLMLMATF